MLDTFPLILAQEDVATPPTLPPTEGEAIEGQAPTGDGVAPAPQQDPGLWGGLMPFFLLLLLIVMFVFMSGGQRKEKKRRQAMLDALKKGDKIQTVGGIIGTLVELRDSEVVVKVDENANTRLRFARTAIQNVLEKEAD